MQRRFHGDLRVRAVESLLFERIPIARLPREELERERRRCVAMVADETADRMWKEDTAAPRVHLHGNGRYALMVTNSGGRLQPLERIRYDAMALRHHARSLGKLSLYPRHALGCDLGGCASTVRAGEPAPVHVRFSADRAEFRRRASGIETMMDVTVAAEDDVELRRVDDHQSIAAEPAAGIHQLPGTGAGSASRRMRLTRRSRRCSSKRSARKGTVC